MPTTEELVAFMARHKYEPKDIARIANVSERTARAWISQKRSTHYKPCPADAWKKILAAAGE